MNRIIYALVGLVLFIASCQDEDTPIKTELNHTSDMITMDTVAKIHKDTLDLNKLNSKVLKKVVKQVFAEKNLLTVTASLALATGGKAYQVNDIQKLLPAIIEVLNKNLKDKTDVVFVIDKTGSMSDDIEKVKKHVGLLIHCLSKFNKVKTAVVLYGDLNSDGDNWLTFDSLNSNHRKSLERLKNITVTGGGDWPESANDAVAQVIKKMNWTSGSSRMVLLIGDAPSLEPPLSKYATKDIIAMCKSDGVVANIYPILFSLDKVAGAVEPTSFTDALYRDAAIPNPEQMKNSIAKLFPNPAEMESNIELAEDNAMCNMLLIDMAGNIIKNESFTGKTHRLDLRKVAAGNYIIRVNGESSKWTDTKKIIVVK